MKKIYILLSRTDTVPARVIRTFKRGSEFSHTSISLIPATDSFYSYARRKMNNPLFAGLVMENIHTKTFALYPDCHCAVYAISVSDDAFERMQLTVEYFLEHYKKAKYNMIGLIPLALGFRIKRKYRLVCSQFAALVLNSSAEIKLPKDPYLMCPDDFRLIEGAECIYDGRLADCVIPADTESDILVETASV